MDQWVKDRCFHFSLMTGVGEYNTKTDRIADIVTKKLVTISEFLSPINFPKNPDIIEEINLQI